MDSGGPGLDTGGSSMGRGVCHVLDFYPGESVCVLYESIVARLYAKIVYHDGVGRANIGDTTSCLYPAESTLNRTRL